MILLINACVRKASRTKRLADRFLSEKRQSITELNLSDIEYPKVDEEFLIKRDSLIAEGDFDNPMFALARQFADADEIVIAAPFWDLSFPASLKQYFEQINVLGITFRYTPEGIPQGLCKAKKLTYITTAGGDFFPEEFGFGYVKALAENFYGIRDVRLIKATGLDIDGADTKKILDSVFKEY
ncbi:MAG: NAD(P)H-dependent oxidoreductase [Clostridia bacterium]|nr:NAD(P)H-dependent oxidoreductase [Clostridia bacterium]